MGRCEYSEYPRVHVRYTLVRMGAPHLQRDEEGVVERAQDRVLLLFDRNKGTHQGTHQGTHEGTLQGTHQAYS